jgi:Flp pilus assembly protein TadG
MRRLVVLVVVALVVVGGAIELGSPYFTQHQVHDVAHAAAVAGALKLATSKDSAAAKVTATQVAKARGATLEFFLQQPNGTVKVTVTKQAKSYLLGRLPATRGWYEVTESASAPG